MCFMLMWLLPVRVSHHNLLDWQPRLRESATHLPGRILHGITYR